MMFQNEHNPDVTSKSGFTPLHIAAHYGNVNIANLLHQKNANINYAAKVRSLPLSRILLVTQLHLKIGSILKIIWC